MSGFNQFKTTITEDSGRYFRYPVDIPRDAYEAEFEYSFFPERGENGKNEIDLILTGKPLAGGEGERDIGTRGSSVGRVVISKAYSTPGYERVSPSEITSVVIGRGRLGSKEVEVVVKWRFKRKERRYYAGDMHTHSVNSDGRLTYEKLLKKGKRKGLDFLFVTDHNRTVTGELPAVAGLTAIEGVEITLFDGHANFLGVRQPYSGSFTVDSLEKWRKLRDEARSNGAFIVVNHPFCKRCPWRWELNAEDFDAAEVINGPPREDNRTATEWWKKQLSVKRLVPVGGSDYHRDYFVVSTLGMPVTFVLADSAEKQDIMEGLRRGHTAVASSLKRGAIELRSGEYVAGDEAPFTGDNVVTVRVPYMKRGEKLRITDGEGVLKEMTAKKSGGIAVSVMPRTKGAFFAEVVSGYRGVKRLAFDILLSFMLPEDAFRRHPEFTFALSAPIYFV